MVRAVVQIGPQSGSISTPRVGVRGWVGWEMWVKRGKIVGMPTFTECGLLSVRSAKGNTRKYDWVNDGRTMTLPGKRGLFKNIIGQTVNPILQNLFQNYTQKTEDKFFKILCYGKVKGGSFCYDMQTVVGNVTSMIKL